MALQELLEALLQHPLIEAAGSSEATASDIPVSPLLVKLRFLVLKNLAALLSKHDATDELSAQRALQLYCQALALEDDSLILWQQMGTLVSPCALVQALE